jgi:protein TonB
MQRRHPAGTIMKLDAWTGGEAADTARRKRLTVGYTFGAVTVGVALTLITYSARGQVFAGEETFDVSLAKAPVTDKAPKATPPPEPEPTPPPEPKARARKPRDPGKVAVATPKNVPDSVPDEAEAGSTAHDGDYDDVFGGGSGGGDDSPKAAKTQPAPRPKAAPALDEPVFVPERERTRPPAPIAQSAPRYPEEARAEGVEGVVTVRFVVSSDGTVQQVQVVSGHPLLDAAVIAAVRTWRFEPATYDDRPIATWQTARFPFRLSK